MAMAGTAALLRAGCTNPHDPTQRTIGGGLIGAGADATIGALAGGGRGAAIGAATTPQPYAGGSYEPRPDPRACGYF